MPLDVKVVLIGAPNWYYTFFSTDPEFQSYFRVKADIDPDFVAEPGNIETYAGLIRHLAEDVEGGGATYADSAIVRLLGQASRWSADRTKLSSQFERIQDVLAEARHLLRKTGGEEITAEIVEATIENRRHRNARIEDRIQEGISGKSVLIATTGTAIGQHIELAMLDTAIAFMWPDSAMDAVLLDDDATRAPTIASVYNTVALADGYAATSVVTESEFRGQCNTFGLPDLADDPRFADANLRRTNRRELNAELKEAAAATTVAQFAERSAQFDLPGATVRTLDELPTDPQVANNGIFIEREHPVAGQVREPRAAARFSETPQRMSDHAPTFGQHSDEIASELGLDAAELRAAGVIF